jgi:hypothetical protein
MGDVSRAYVNHSLLSMTEKKVQVANPADMLEVVCDMPPALAGLLFEFPSHGQKWSTSARERWMAAFNAVCDMLYPDSIDDGIEDVGDEDEEGETEPEPEEVPDPPAVRPRGRPRKVTTTVSASVHQTTEEHEEASAPAEQPESQQPYRGSKMAAQRVWDTIQQYAKAARIVVNPVGRVRICATEYQLKEGERDAGVYYPSSTVSNIRVGLLQAGINDD